MAPRTRLCAFVAAPVAAAALAVGALSLRDGEAPAAAAPQAAALAPATQAEPVEAAAPVAARPNVTRGHGQMSTPPEPTATAPAAAPAPAAEKTAAEAAARPSVTRGHGQVSTPRAPERAPARAKADAADDLSSDRLDKPEFDREGRKLPAGTSWALPPMIRLRAAAGPVAEPPAKLAAQVLASKRFALAPAARRNVEKGRVSPAALALLLRLRGNGPPLLVHAARGRDLRVQETSLKLTRRTVSRLDALPPAQRPASLRLKAVRADLADAGTARPDAGSPGSIGRAAADLALKYLGVPYVWGGASPEQGMDCSGLVQYVYGQLGIPLTHYAAFQFREGDPVPSHDLRPGDLVFFNPKADGPGHVGIYIGDGLMVHAPRRGDVVRIADLASRASRYMGAVRPY